MTSRSAAITSSIPAPASSIPTVSVASVPSSSSQAILYRGATVEDLQLPPAVCVSLDSNILTSLTVAEDHDYSQLPVLDSNDRKLKGYLDIKELKNKIQNGQVHGSDGIEKCLKRFRGIRSGNAGQGGNGNGAYTLIQPDTGLADLEQSWSSRLYQTTSTLSLILSFLKILTSALSPLSHLQPLFHPVFLRTQPFAFVTDPSRAFVLAVATMEDLQRYSERRGLGFQRDGAITPTNAVKSSNQNQNNGAGGIGMTRREEEEARKDRTLAEFLRLMDGYEPLIPDEVTSHYLQKVGFECEDQRLKRLLSLAAEKFVSDIATDAFQYARIRTAGAPIGRPPNTGNVGRPPNNQSGTTSSNANDRSRTVLTMDDLSAALAEHGVGARRAEFYR